MAASERLDAPLSAARATRAHSDDADDRRVPRRRRAQRGIDRCGRRSWWHLHTNHGGSARLRLRSRPCAAAPRTDLVGALRLRPRRERDRVVAGVASFRALRRDGASPASAVYRRDVRCRFRSIRLPEDVPARAAAVGIRTGARHPAGRGGDRDDALARPRRGVRPSSSRGPAHAEPGVVHRADIRPRFPRRLVARTRARRIRRPDPAASQLKPAGAPPRSDAPAAWALRLH